MLFRFHSIKSWFVKINRSLMSCPNSCRLHFQRFFYPRLHNSRWAASGGGLLFIIVKITSRPTLSRSDQYLLLSPQPSVSTMPQGHIMGGCLTSSLTFYLKLAHRLQLIQICINEMFFLFVGLKTDQRCMHNANNAMELPLGSHLLWWARHFVESKLCRH